ncbi:MAG: DNA mismatch repair protein MutL, partial [Flavobacteriaceae bacterium]|nr:DNA mismatch repair protein MutL [Flavobacteriaceae bacterium]
SAGFQFGEFTVDTISLTGIPSGVLPESLQTVFEELCEAIRNEVPDSSFSQLDTIAKSLAKSMAVKIGTKLSTKEQEDLLEKLFSCKEPNQSPFGKKIFVTLSLEEIQLKFDI